MDHSRPPIEMCEHIIDSVGHRTGWYHTALVCSAWLPRSRFNLYHHISLQRPKQADLLLQTLEENSRLAHLVVGLEVGIVLHPLPYTPFAQLFHLLQNCVILDLRDIDWETYPPRFVDTCLYRISLMGIADFKVKVSRSTARRLLRLIRSLTKLEQLTLFEDFRDKSFSKMEPIRALGARREQNGKPAALSTLKQLRLMGNSVSIKFPPHYFGDTVVDLSLCCLWREDDSTSLKISLELLQCIENFQRLRTLHIELGLDKQDDTYDPLPMSKIRKLFSILTRVSSGSALHTLSINLYPQQGPETGYTVGRSGLLDLLLGVDMLKVLDGFPSLSQLHFRLREDDEDHDKVWWKEQMVRRLPSHLYTVTVTIEPYMYNNGPYLWQTEDEINPLTQKNAENIVTNESTVNPSIIALST
ncbi:hypothetical protein C8Q74DRAFT_965868 [Fomes fomentarius]|nr:hypothetical protein C8Q74DRAFT_965868 [Fomes fomentarius]